MTALHVTEHAWWPQAAKLIYRGWAYNRMHVQTSRSGLQWMHPPPCKLYKASELMQCSVPSPAVTGTHRRIPLAEGLGALHISQHKRHLISSIAQQLLDPSKLADPRVVVLGPCKADDHNGNHGQQHWQHNLIPGSHARKHWDHVWHAPGFTAKEDLHHPHSGHPCMLCNHRQIYTNLWPFTGGVSRAKVDQMQETLEDLQSECDTSNSMPALAE